MVHVSVITRLSRRDRCSLSADEKGLHERMLKCFPQYVRAYCEAAAPFRQYELIVGQ